MSISMADRFGIKRSERGVLRRLVEWPDLGVFAVRFLPLPGVAAAVAAQLTECEASRAFRCQRGKGTFATGAAKLLSSSSDENLAAVVMVREGGREEVSRQVVGVAGKTSDWKKERKKERESA